MSREGLGQETSFTTRSAAGSVCLDVSCSRGHLKQSRASEATLELPMHVVEERTVARVGLELGVKEPGFGNNLACRRMREERSKNEGEAFREAFDQASFYHETEHPFIPRPSETITARAFILGSQHWGELESHVWSLAHYLIQTHRKPKYIDVPNAFAR